MKSFGLLLGLLLTFNVISASANECNEGFFSKATESDFQNHKVSKENSGEILRGMFDLIMNSPSRSTVKIYTKTLSFDGIGSLLLMTSISEARKDRNLKFEIYLEDFSTVSRLHTLFADLNSNKLFFAQNPEQFTNSTLVVVESSEGTRYLEFERDLTSASLKDSSQKGPIPVKYDGRNMLRASPFIDNIDVVKGSASDSLRVRLSELSKDYEPFTARTPNTEEANKQKLYDLDGVLSRGNDLALQLYHKEYGRAPKDVLNTMGILREVIGTSDQ